MAVFALLLTPKVSSNDWDRAGAQNALEEARRQREAIHKSSESSPQSYLACIQKFKLVYLRDPHYGGSDNAIYEAALLYEEMGDKFGSLDYYREAAKLFRFLVSDYGGSPFCPEALLRIGDLNAGPLQDQKASEEAYELLRTQHESSKAAAAFAARSNATSKVSSRQEQSAANIQSIRHWSADDYTRIVIDLDGEARYRGTRLSNPDRIYFDISKARVGRHLHEKTLLVDDALVKQIRVAQNSSDVVRVVLDFSALGDYEVSERQDPFRIIIDVRGTGTQPGGLAVLRSKHPEADKDMPAAPADSKTTFQAEKATAFQPISVQNPQQKSIVAASKIEAPTDISAKEHAPATRSTVPAAGAALTTTAEAAVAPKPAALTSRGDRTLTRMLGLKIGRIVLDPGHGGHDTGTIGRGGLKEKDLVLQVALNLKELLEQKLGAEVVLTRNDDRFVSLEERTALANQHRADLFVSIHANASRSRSTSGVETYFLDFANTAEAREVAARENSTTVQNIRDLEDLVKKITQADKSAESRELAAIIQKNLYRDARKLYPSASNRGVRSAPFVVLIGANMPSVLAEVGFISNPRDEDLLQKEGSREHLAKALFSGIEAYMKTLGSDVAQNRSD